MRRQPSRFQGVFLVLPAAAAAAVIVALLGLPTQKDVVPGIPADAIQLTVGEKPVSRAVPSGFLGLSMEYTTLPAFAASSTAPTELNPLFIRLLRDLTPGQRPVLRIGGDSTDWAYWPTRGVKRPGGIRITLTPAWMQTTRALEKAIHPRFILGLDLEANSRRLATAEAAALIRGLGPQAIEALELGNEPEVYGAIGWYRNAKGRIVRARRRGYGYPDYVREFTRFAAALPPAMALAGPASGGPKWWAQTESFLRSEPRARVVTYHLYPLHSCYVGRRSPAVPTVAHLLAPSSTTGLAGNIAPYIPAVHRAGALARVDELNSVSCGGKEGVSEGFASSLWMLGALLELARVGADGVNVHMSTHTIYRPFDFTRGPAGWSANVKPEYYAMLAFARAVPPGSRLLEVSDPGVSTLSAWGVRTPTGRTRAVLVNTSATSDRTIALRLPGAGRFAALTRLTAPSETATTGVSLGGQRFLPGTTTARLVGRRHTIRVTRTRNGFFLLRVPAASAAVISG